MRGGKGRDWQIKQQQLLQQLGGRETREAWQERETQVQGVKVAGKQGQQLLGAGRSGKAGAVEAGAGKQGQQVAGKQDVCVERALLK